jgi:hypothetical protein
LSLGSPQFEMQQNPVEFKPVAKKKEPVEGLILFTSFWASKQTLTGDINVTAIWRERTGN